MIPTLTLTPCRSTGPRRTARIVMYRREGDRVSPYLAQMDEAGRVSVERIAWREISESAVDPEFEQDWLAHVELQAKMDSNEQQCPTASQWTSPASA